MMYKISGVNILAVENHEGIILSNFDSPMVLLPQIILSDMKDIAVW